MSDLPWGRGPYELAERIEGALNVTSCDAGRLLHELLDLLADANMQEDDEDDWADDRFDRKSYAKSALFVLATKRALAAKERV